ncbi:uncharacterized protein LOC106135838 [Amyelois transitella]|uniref:uncharacterized protein LOC106135838 n=1 Tax=Amyelois transitella TaxID=680683 RepID=UPI00298F4132|nr:uncharacterized protein LOC106135838 [Amyelois transitella]
MKWYVILWLATARSIGGSVLRCTVDSKDPLCISENQDRVSQLKKADLPSGKECAPETSWKTECNSCKCNADGRAMCTLQFCPDESFLSCAPGSMWKNDCNMCQCTANGRPVCTRMDCVPPSDILDPVNFEPEVPENIPNKDSVNVKSNSINTGHKISKKSVCKPHQEFQSECNSCTCSGDGLSYSCTHNECLERDMTKEVEVFMESEGVDHIEKHSVCKARETFPIGCNTCHCNLDGTDYSCTNKPCPLPKDVEVFHEPKTTTSSTNKTVICEANRSFKKDCNICWCNEDGTSFFCTRRACVPLLPDEADDEKPEDLRIIKKECRPNEVFELDCNMCRCNPDGKSFSCTRRACVDQLDDFKINASATIIRKARSSQEPQKTCQPGTEFRMDCNKCLCDNEGQDFSCTRIDCNALNNNGNAGNRNKRDAAERVPADCTPGSVFERRCNVCRCTEVGYALCTTNKCQEKDATDKPTTEVPGPAVDANFRCNPGEQYNFDCNDCTCSADGKSIFCTLRFCDKSLSPD